MMQVEQAQKQSDKGDIQSRNNEILVNSAQEAVYQTMNSKQGLEEEDDEEEEDEDEEDEDYDDEMEQSVENQEDEQKAKRGRPKK